MKDGIYDPPIPVELIWRDAIGVPGPVNLDDEKGVVLHYIGYLAEKRDGFITLVAEYDQKNPANQRDRGDIPMADVISITELYEGRKLYGKVQRKRRK